MGIWRGSVAHLRTLNGVKVSIEVRQSIAERLRLSVGVLANCKVDPSFESDGKKLLDEKFYGYDIPRP